MRSSKALRGMLFCSYWVVAFVVVFLSYRNDDFCFEPGKRNFTIMTAQLTLAFAVWDSIVSVGVAMALGAKGKVRRLRWVSPFVTALIAGAGIVYLPFWIYEGYGVFRFDHTWADISCIFTEMGNLFLYLLIVAPLLILMTFLREVLLVRFRDRSN
jgi:hypothetical protein